MLNLLRSERVSFIWLKKLSLYRQGIQLESARQKYFVIFKQNKLMADDHAAHHNDLEDLEVDASLSSKFRGRKDLASYLRDQRKYSRFLTFLSKHLAPIRFLLPTPISHRHCLWSEEIFWEKSSQVSLHRQSLEGIQCGETMGSIWGRWITRWLRSPQHDKELVILWQRVPLGNHFHFEARRSQRIPHSSYDR